MSAQRFVAANATDALRRIRAELGGDAVVLSSNDVAGGVEILAIAAADLVGLSPAEQVPRTGSLQERARSFPDTRPDIRQAVAPMLATPTAAQPLDRTAAIAPPPLAAAPPPRTTAATAPVRTSAAAVTAPVAMAGGRLPTGGTAAGAQGLQALSSQMAEVKSLLSNHLAANYWASLQQTAPGHAQLTRRLLNAGLSSQTISRMLAELPPEPDFDRLLAGAQRWLQSHLQLQDAFSLFDTGGVYAFIGPTGVGKTTTLAKIAARCVLRYGRRQVALMTTDTYRIGAQEQLRVFARILNLPVVSLRDSDDLESKVTDLSSRRIVLLDTAGVGQRDTMMVEQLEMIRQGCGAVHRVLVMSATTSTRTLDDVIESHQHALGGQGLHSAILTKIDEGMSLAPAIDCVLRHRLPLLFLSNGQRVPEDLFAPDAAYIAHRTVNPRGRDDTAADDAHVPAIIADDISAWTPEARSA